MTEREWPPGLKSWDIIASDDETVTIREVWDPRVPGCPLLVYETGTWPLKIQTDVESVTHVYKKPRDNGELKE